MKMFLVKIVYLYAKTETQNSEKHWNVIYVISLFVDGFN